MGEFGEAPPRTAEEGVEEAAERVLEAEPELPVLLELLEQQEEVGLPELLELLELVELLVLLEKAALLERLVLLLRLPVLLELLGQQAVVELPVLLVLHELVELLVLLGIIELLVLLDLGGLTIGAPRQGLPAAPSIPPRGGCFSKKERELRASRTRASCFSSFSLSSTSPTRTGDSPWPPEEWGTTLT